MFSKSHIKAKIKKNFWSGWDEFKSGGPAMLEVAFANLAIATAIFMLQPLDSFHRASPFYYSMTRAASGETWVSIFTLISLLPIYGLFIAYSTRVRKNAAQICAVFWTYVAIQEYMSHVPTWVIWVACWQAFWQVVIFKRLVDGAPKMSREWLERLFGDKIDFREDNLSRSSVKNARTERNSSPNHPSKRKRSLTRFRNPYFDIG